MKQLASYALVGVLIVFLVGQRCEMSELKRNQVTGLQPAQYHLPDDVVTIAQMDAHIMKAIRRVGPDSVFISETYIPAESTIEYIVRVDTIAMGELEEAQRLLARLELEMATSSDSAAVEELRIAVENLRAAIVITEINFDTHGLCMVPVAGVAIDSDAETNIEAGFRVGYWNRAGVGFHALAEVPKDEDDNWTGAAGGFIDYKLPWWDNVAPFLGLEYDLGKMETQGSAGIHGYFN